jgi:protein-tyrosine-phosphatase
LKKLLFVCSGNTCRSPLAEGIAKKIFSEELPERVEVSSAGSSAVDGAPASPLAVDVAGRRSIDLTGHRARFLDRSLVKDADLIVTMGAKHKETVGVIDPAARRYTYLLTDFCDDATGDIPDPIGSGIDEYDRTYRVLENCIRRMAERLRTFDGWKD